MGARSSVTGAIALLFVLAASLLSGCEKNEVTDDRVGVVVSIQPVAGFVEAVGGERVRVTVMVPPGASPHTYEPTPKRLKGVTLALMYAKVGSGIEFELEWMDKLTSLNKKMLVVDCSTGIERTAVGGGRPHVHFHGEEAHEMEEDVHEMEEEAHGEEARGDHGHGDEDPGEGQGGMAGRQAFGDPHIWLSPKNAAVMAGNIYRGLVAVDPEGEAYYGRRRDAFVEELEGLDREIREALSRMRTRKVMVYHAAWSHFTREYGLEEIPIERDGKEATPWGILDLVDIARREGIRVIFASPEFSTRSAEVVAREIGGEVILISPLEKDYAANMRKVAEAFSRL